MKMELDYIEKLIKMLTDNELTELSLEEGDKAIVIRKEKEIVTTAVAAGQTFAVPQQIPASAPKQTETSAQKEESAQQSAQQSNLLKIVSPMVGTFYKASSPSTPAFTEAGKTVSVGQVVCIIEAMKLMNEIESEVAGKVVEVCVQDGQPVEYGQVLMLVEP